MGQNPISQNAFVEPSSLHPHSGSDPGDRIGVFDSGVGGLSILRALRAELPAEDFVYLADAGFAPYGERSEAFVVERARAVAQRLRNEHGIKALVIACNTATAAAVQLLRGELPELPIVGVEPALKPALALTRTGRIGVFATRGTLASAKFASLLQSVQDSHTQFRLQPCDGLADAIENHDEALIGALCRRYTSESGPFGSGAGEIDTLVLGCTHYPFAQDTLRALLGPSVQLVETGLPVARQTRRVLDAGGLLRPGTHPGGTVSYLSTGDEEGLRHAAARWLGAGSGASGG